MQDREEQYYWVLAAMQKVWPGLPNVRVWDYSRYVVVVMVAW
jgi:glutamyl-tRNA synthetase